MNSAQLNTSHPKSHSRKTCRLTALGVLLFSLSIPARGDLNSGDAHWARRAEGYAQGRADSRPIAAAISEYERVVAAEPANLGAAWRLLRALQFQGQFAVEDRAAKQQVFDRARSVSERALNSLANRFGGRAKFDALDPKAAARTVATVPEVAPFFLWSAVNWGLWGETFGPFAAARQGAGDRIRRLAEIASALDERFDEGAPHRVLGRLHARAPKIPFFTGWVDRSTAINELRHALAISPTNFHNRLFLAEALIDHEPSKKPEALRLLRELVTEKPPESSLVEANDALAQARALLARTR